MADSFYETLQAGDLALVREALTRAPSLAITSCGPKNWEPLLYVCFAGKGDPELARLLLEHGANPNATFTDAHWPNCPLSCLYGATGRQNNVPLARVLLDAGANPDDGESLYHSTEYSDLACVRLLLQRGAKVNGTSALNHMLDREDPEGLRLLLEAGGDPNERNGCGETSLHWAIWRDRTPNVLRMLLEYGAELNAQRKDGRTAYALAAILGQTEAATFLAEQGADTQLLLLDRALTNESEPMPEAVDFHGSERLLPDLTTRHRTAAVRKLLEAGFPVGAKGELGATALHWACWQGYADLVDLLLRHGASLDVRDGQFDGTPPGWFMHGLHNCQHGRGDYVATAKILRQAGAHFAAGDLPTGNQAVDAILLEEL